MKHRTKIPEGKKNSLQPMKGREDKIIPGAKVSTEYLFSDSTDFATRTYSTLISGSCVNSAIFNSAGRIREVIGRFKRAFVKQLNKISDKPSVWTEVPVCTVLAIINSYNEKNKNKEEQKDER